MFDEREYNRKRRVRLARNAINTLFLLLAVLQLNVFALNRNPQAPQQSVVIKSEARVNAGESITFDIYLNVAPDAPESWVSVLIRGPNNVQSGQTEPIKPGQTAYHIPVRIPADAPGGTWSVFRVSVGTSSGMNYSELKFDKWTFEVIQPAHFVFPTEAKVTISLSQAQLLRSEAAILKNKIETLTASLASVSDTQPADQVRRVLRQNVQDADKALNATEEKFLELTSMETQKNAARVFFDDLHTTYQHTLTGINSSQLYTPARFQSSRMQSRGHDSIEVVIGVFELNARAYNLVAETGSITFDLKVISVPAGATVTYGRRGDSSFAKLQDPTNSEIKGLPYAIWIVRFEKPGYGLEELTHDPFANADHVVVMELHPGKKRAK